MTARRNQKIAVFLSVPLLGFLAACSGGASAAPGGGADSKLDPAAEQAAAIAEVSDHSLVAGPPAGEITAPADDQGLPPVIKHIETADPVVFLTIDDGYAKDPKVMDVLKASGIPVTPFLTRVAIADNKAYFKDVSTLTGQTVQNHTLTHPQLPGLSQSGQQDQICQTSDTFADWFGARPWMLRPPYGESNTDTQRASKACGIDYIVNWNVSLPLRFLRYAEGNSLKSGDIILTHWRPDLYKHLPRALKDIKKQGFKVAALQDYLPKKS